MNHQGIVGHSAYAMLWLGVLIHAAQAQNTASAPASQAVESPAPYHHFHPARRDAQRQFEQQLNAMPAGKSLRAWHDMLASEPHIAGSAADHRLIDRMAEELRTMGLDVQVHEFWPYLSSPISAKLQIIQGETIDLPVRESPVDEDKFVSGNDLPIGFNAYSGSGDVTGEVVYANFGTLADFEKLKSLGVDCRGKVVLARYGGNFRGYKAKFAQAAGAAALIIFSDADDVGYRQGVAYPEGGWANESYIQRGSILTLDYPGDPLTPGVAATENAPRLNPDEVALPRIPVQPIGYGAAGEILKRMRGRPLPRDIVKSWQGGLPCAYRLEGGPELKLRVQVTQERRIVRTANVIATIKGSKHPEQQILIGCHHDAWCHGAGDPAAGTMLVFEAAKSFAHAARSGHRPLRSIVFCLWGAEEHGIIGSTEYCEQYADELRRSAIAYLNLDAATMGVNFSASAAPPLKTLIEEITRDVVHVDGAATGQSVHAKWIGEAKQVSIGDLGGGSDHIGLYCHLGVPCGGFGAHGAPGTAYHSVYDNLHWYRKVVGETYEPAVMLTHLVNLFAARLANADLLPLDAARFVPDTRTHIESLANRAKQKSMTIDFAPINASLDRFEALIKAVPSDMLALLSNTTPSADDMERANSLLRTLSRRNDGRADDAGLADRPWFKNRFASSDPTSGYASWMLPEIRLAIENADSALLSQSIARFAADFDALSSAIESWRITRPGSVDRSGASPDQASSQ